MHFLLEWNSLGCRRRAPPAAVTLFYDGRPIAMLSFCRYSTILSVSIPAEKIALKSQSRQADAKRAEEG